MSTFHQESRKTDHMDLQRGDLANRILTVGSFSRLQVIAGHLDEPHPKEHTSPRGFSTVTGTFGGVPVSIVSIGMGAAMMDFFVRESMEILSGPTAIVRFGTCGGMVPKAVGGTISLAAKGAAFASRNYDAFLDETGATPHYNLSKLVTPDPTLTELVRQEFAARYGEERLLEGVNITCDTFYATQGRHSDIFEDYSEDVIDYYKSVYPDLVSLEMETFILFHLAKCSKVPIFAAGAAIVMKNRAMNEDYLPADQREEMESEGGRAVLTALCKLQL